MRLSEDDLYGVKQALIARIEALCRALLGEPNRAFSTKSDMRFGNKGSLVVNLAHKRGVWFSHETGIGGGPIDLIMFTQGITFSRALEWAVEWLVGAAPATVERPTDVPEESTKPQAQALWRESMSARGTGVEKYLESRGCALPSGGVLRFHPRCPRGGGEHFERLPAMLALMTEPINGKPCGVHRTYLRSDGTGKADGKAKMMLGDAGVIRLAPDDEITNSLGLTEGIETALKLMRRAKWRPIWAAGSAGPMARFPVLPGEVALTLFPDLDEINVKKARQWQPAGFNAARQCAENWRQQHRKARIVYPPPGKDWDDAIAAMEPKKDG